MVVVMVMVDGGVFAASFSRSAYSYAARGDFYGEFPLLREDEIYPVVVFVVFPIRCYRLSREKRYRGRR